ncbi:putative fatty acyl-CoA reductase CG5065 isoform X3 [Periplaneta americana]|uniref:putative fatty acyl-CoA reductase CG5065 isoform X3 n=1 Tax=Periplaneta americana TaxID=6978 RepID=UPI0037E846DD
MERTPIQEFYKERSLLITGATGFCGKSLLEKLLRSCPDVGNIFLLMRPKKGQDVTRRLAKLFDDPVFNTVRRNYTQPMKKVIPMTGDITQPGLGLSPKDRDRLCREVSIVFHAAATIKFNENLKVALQTNVMGTQEIVYLCKEMPQIVALVYVSTAYSNCSLKEIDEKVYPPPHDPRRLTECVNWMSETDFQSIEPTIIGKWPNTYTYSKALAEHVISENRDILPVAIFRPSIVISTWKEPIPGWIDNMNGPTMGIMGCSMGMIRCGHVDTDKICDIVPVDTVVNALIATAWETSFRGKVDLYYKSLKFLALVSSFSTQEWTFHDANVRSLLSSLSPQDKDIFYFDLTQLEWKKFLKTYMAGIRFFLLKENESTLPAARKRYRKLHVLHCLFQFGLILFFYRSIQRLCGLLT